MNDIYVPMLIEEKAQLYLVETDFQTTDTVCFSICNRMKGQGNEGINTLIDKIGSYYKDYKRISLKLKEEKNFFKQKSKEYLLDYKKNKKAYSTFRKCGVLLYYLIRIFM